MKRRIFNSRIKYIFMKRTAILSFVLMMLFSLLAISGIAAKDNNQHKTNVLTGGHPIDSYLTIKKTVRNADGSPLDLEQCTKQFAFSVVFSDGGTYQYFILNTAELLSVRASTPEPGNEIMADESGADLPDILEVEPHGRDDDSDLPDGDSEVQSSAGEDGLPTDDIEDATDGDGSQPSIPEISDAGASSATDDNTEIIALPSVGAEIIREGTLASGGTIYLSHGQIAVFPYLPAGTAYEVEELPPNGYSLTGIGWTGDITEFGASASFINAYDAETVDINGEKFWDLTDVPEGYVMLTEITIYLKDGDDIVREAKVRKNAGGRWLFSFTNLPKYRPDGSIITYTVDEVRIPNYTKQINDYNITNTYSGSTTTPTPTPTPTPSPTPTLTPIPSPTPTPTPVSPTESPPPDEENITPAPPPQDDGRAAAQPQTGDHQNLALWVTLLSVAAAGLIMLFIRQKPMYEQVCHNGRGDTDHIEEVEKSKEARSMKNTPINEDSGVPP